MLTNFSFRYAAGALCAASLLFAPAAVHAQAFLVNFVPATQTVLPNMSTTFSGTITNTTDSDLYINGDSVDPIVDGLTTDDTPFYNTFGGAPILLASKGTYTLTDFFTVTDLSAPVGTYKGQFTVYGGAAPDSSDMSGFQTFFVTVAAPVPEAATSLSFGVLLAAGALLLTVQRRRRTAAL